MKQYWYAVFFYHIADCTVGRIRRIYVTKNNPTTVDVVTKAGFGPFKLRYKKHTNKHFFCPTFGNVKELLLIRLRSQIKQKEETIAYLKGQIAEIEALTEEQAEDW